MDLLVNIADGMQTVREWWAPIFNTMEKLRDEVSCATGEFILENDMTSLRYICTAMDLYYSEYGACVKEMLQVVSVRVSVGTGYHLNFLLCSMGTLTNCARHTVRKACRNTF
ncbi:hypothetical protein SCLCIDRAFT_739972 [Scleroderma citrinum Foug A]|uniref:Uncharacterized protein n=1 Tax=Scleroderma citrinum Foug A TaxID=1036808 RepID=A0A0C2ZD90_9AGAM|nr:hypothetical protein SCLCIDRAFT_739972 [Scleroderma citrinum Foug A]